MKIIWLPTFFLVTKIGDQKRGYINNLSPGHSTRQGEKPMKIQTFSIVVGNRACDAHCPFCVSKMTGFETVTKRTAWINEVNFKKACQLAVMAKTSTVLLTGKGEPTLHSSEIGRYLDMLAPWNFPFIELQTNGLMLGRLAAGQRDGLPKDLNEETLVSWRNRGLNTVAISVVDIKNWRNATIYNMDYPDLVTTVKYLHRLGFTVRLCVMMLKGYVDSVERVKEVIDFCRVNQVEQLTIRPITMTRFQNMFCGMGWSSARKRQSIGGVCEKNTPD